MSSTKLPCGYSFRRLDLADAEGVGGRSQTAVGYFMQQRATEDARYYELTTGDGRFAAVLGVLPEGRAWMASPKNARKELLITGYRNSSPYDEHACAIGEMGEALQLDLSPASACPYARPRSDSGLEML